MKQSILILCVVFFVSSHVLGQGYVITGELSGANGQTVSLRQYRDFQPVEVNSTTVQAGKFTLTGTTPYPEFCMLYVGDQGPLVQFFIENSNIRISADPANPEKAKVTGSKETDSFMEFVDQLEKYAQQQKQLNDSYVSLSSSSVASPDAIMNIRLQAEKLNTDRRNYMVNYVLNNPGKISSAFIVSAFPVSGNTTLMQILDISQKEQVANGFGSKTGQSQWVKVLKDNVAALKRTDIGQPFPDVTLKTPDDQPISISDFAGKGKYVLLDFWAAWCGPCRVENPHVVQLYKRYKDKGFEIIGISLDRGKAEWVEAIKKDNLTWPQMSDLKYFESNAAQLYSVNSIPHTVLLDKDGKIIAKGLRGEALTAKLAELMD